MKKINVFLSVIFFTLFSSLYSQQNIYQIKKDYLQDYALVKSRYGRIIRHAFARVDYLQNVKSDFSRYISSSDIQKIFHADLKKTNVLSKAQNLIVAQLYILYFKFLIKKTEMLLYQIIEAQKYWNYELIKEQSAAYKKLPTYWFHSLQSKQMIKNKIALLESLEYSVSHILGVSFCGIYNIKNIQNFEEIEIVLQKTLKPLYDVCNFDYKKYASDEEKFTSVSALYDSIKIFLHNIEIKLAKHGVPNHVLRNGCFYAGVAVTSFAAIIFYQIYKDNFSKYMQYGKQTVFNFYKEYLVDPALGLKKAVFDYEELEEVVQVPQSLLECKWWFSADILVYFFRDYLSQLNQKLTCVLKRQQINYYLSSIGPVLYLAYLASRTTSSIYNYESYYRPMRLIMRDISIVLTKMLGADQINFSESGKLYFLVNLLSTYIGCLNKDELFAIKQDIKELLSLRYTCEQKQKVLERMYRTYHFLKETT